MTLIIDFLLFLCFSSRRAEAEVDTDPIIARCCWIVSSGGGLIFLATLEWTGESGNCISISPPEPIRSAGLVYLFNADLGFGDCGCVCGCVCGFVYACVPVCVVLLIDSVCDFDFDFD